MYSRTGQLEPGKGGILIHFGLEAARVSWALASSGYEMRSYTYFGTSGGSCTLKNPYGSCLAHLRWTAIQLYVKS